MNDCLYQLEDMELHCSELINEKNEMKEVFRQRLVAYNKQKNINLMLNRLLHFHQNGGNHRHRNSEGRYEKRSGHTRWLLFVMLLLLVIWLLLFLAIFLYLKLLSSDPVLLDRILK
jgi:hypothetical protein